MKDGSALISAMTCCWCMGEKLMLDPERALRMMSRASMVSGREEGESELCREVGRGDLNSSPSLPLLERDVLHESRGSSRETDSSLEGRNIRVVGRGSPHLGIGAQSRDVVLAS
jgi:hypothetical protein